MTSTVEAATVYTPMVLNTGVIPRFVQIFLETEEDYFKYEISYILINVGTLSPEKVAELFAESGLVKRLIELLTTCDNYFVLENAVWLLENISEDCQVIKNQMIQHGCIKAFETLDARIRTVLPPEKLTNFIILYRIMVMGDNYPPFEKIRPLMFILTEHCMMSLSNEPFVVDLAVQCILALNEFTRKKKYD